MAEERGPYHKPTTPASVQEDNIIPFEPYRARSAEEDLGGGSGSNRGRRRRDEGKEIECATLRRETTIQIGHGLKQQGWSVDSPPDVNDYRWEAQQNASFQGAKLGKNKIHPLARTAYFHTNIDPKEHFSSDMNPAAERNEREYQLKMRLAKQRRNEITPRAPGT